ncbi:MAG: alpha/beta hydrolase [Promethearchaeota archaeon]|nr:MAG: alpha/beta hydrolase [Candidatus Lokiarchaeota archaeon]
MLPEKTVLIFVHGAMGSHNIWKKQVERLSSKVKILAVDLPGHEENQCTEIPNLNSYIAYLKETIEQNQVEKVILAGHSMGGGVVMLYYLQYPEKVAGLILVGTGARLKVMPIILELTKKDIPQVVKMMGTVAFHKKTKKYNPEIIEEVSKSMACISSTIGHQDFSICNNFDVMDKITAIKIPTLIICGDDDKLTPVKYSRYLNEHIPASKLHIVENAGHMVMVEQPTIVNEAIEEFLESLE